MRPGRYFVPSKTFSQNKTNKIVHLVPLKTFSRNKMRGTSDFSRLWREVRERREVMRLATLRVPFLCSLPEGPLHASWSSRPPHSSSPRFRRSRSDISLRLRRGFAKRERENSVQVNLTLFSLSRFAERTRFELVVENNPYDSLANCWFQPLTHLSRRKECYLF